LYLLLCLQCLLPAASCVGFVVVVVGIFDAVARGKLNTAAVIETEISEG